MNKTCPKCGESKPLDEFAYSHRYSDKRQSHCRACSNEAGRKNYQENKERYKAKATERHEKMRAWLRELKNNPCMDCGIKYPPMVMEFDHIGNDKVMGVAEMMRRRFARAKIEAEVAKCELVCANCHRLRTIRRLESEGEEVPV